MISLGTGRAVPAPWSDPRGRSLQRGEVAAPAMSGAAKGRAAAPAAGGHRGDPHHAPRGSRPFAAAGPAVPPPPIPPRQRSPPPGSRSYLPPPAARAGLRFPARQIPRRLQPEEPPPPPPPAASGEEGGRRAALRSRSIPGPARPGQVRPAAGEAAQPRGRELGFSPFPPLRVFDGRGKTPAGRCRAWPGHATPLHMRFN